MQSPTARRGKGRMIIAAGACLLVAVAGTNLSASPLPFPADAGTSCPGPALTLDRLALVSRAELEQLYAQSEPGTIPEGFLRGRPIYCPDTRLAGAKSKMTGAVWRGKVFDPCEGILVNQWRGLRAIRAEVGYGVSWADGRPSIVMDYGQ